MTSLNINVSQESVVKLALAANEKDVTLKQYIDDIIEAHVEKLTTNNNHKTSVTAPPSVTIEDVDIDDQKQQAKQSSQKATSKHRGQPLYNKKETNTWKIW